MPISLNCKNLIIAISIIFLFISCKSRQKTLKIDEVKESKEMDLDFPYDVLGVWEGSIEIFQANGLQQTVAMAVYIEASSDDKVFKWQMTYNEKELADQRNYLLIEVDRAKGQYKIDEDNGIVLDCYLLGNKLISTFSVQGTLLTTIYTFLQDDIIFEVTAGPLEAINITGDMKIGEEVIPPVSSYKTSTYQRGVLKRIRG